MLSNTATPVYYGEFREKVLRGIIPVCQEIELQMNRIDEKIRDPHFYYDDEAINGWIRFCEKEMTLTDGSDLVLMDSFKLWAEDLLSWFYFSDMSVFVPAQDGYSGHYEMKTIKQRLVNKQYLIVPRGAAKSMYAALLQAFWLNIDTSTTPGYNSSHYEAVRRSYVNHKDSYN